MAPEDPPTLSSEPEAAGLHVIAIGASAGGLEALELFFQQAPTDIEAAYVVVQHLSPDFESRMSELLARHTSMPIRQAENELKIEAQHVYLLPPRKKMILANGRLLLTDKDPDAGLSLPIDEFFRSLAQDAGPRAVAVVLSGTGSDGSRGVMEVHAEGGLVLVQQLDTARFDGMPKSAEETGFADMLLPPESMGPVIRQFVEHELSRDELAKQQAPGATQGMAKLVDLLRQRYGIDFSHYKQTTVMRRVMRRAEMLNVDSISDYADRVSESTEELNSLYKDLLIGVTRFFRDTEAFERLSLHVLPTMLARQTSDRGELRIWVAGCATGEEAYSLAILLHEQIEASGRNVEVKIFATDVHRASLEVASTGVYPAEALSEVSAIRRKRYFIETETGCRVTSDLRQMIVFAPHNLLTDAPFTKLDLISCRNLLIYFQPLAQKKALSLFHFGLKTGGFLMLGSSESPGDLSDEFETIDQTWRIFRKRRDVRLTADLRMPLGPTTRAALGSETDMAGSSPQQPSLLPIYDELLGEYMPPSLLVDENGNLVHCFGGAEQFVRFKAGRPSTKVLDLVGDELRTTLFAALQQAQKTRKPVEIAAVRLHIEGEAAPYSIRICPREDTRNRRVYYLVSLMRRETLPPRPSEEDPVAVSPGEASGEASLERIDALESELQFTRENLQATVEELETSNEELQATNEELVASNEELQSTNEELHSVNEELYSVNAEHQRKIDELLNLNSDLESLIASTEVAVVFLDDELKIRKLTPPAAKLMNLMPQDIGRPLFAFSHPLLPTELQEDIGAALRNGESRQREVSSETGEYMVRCLPHDVGDQQMGVVLSVFDITEVKRSQRELAEREERLGLLLASAAEAIYGIDMQGKCTFCNDACLHVLGYESEQDLLGRNMHDLIHHKDAQGRPIPRSDCRIYRSYLADEQTHGDDEVFWRADGTSFPVEYWSQPIKSRGEIVGAVVSFFDISQRQAEHAESLLKGQLIDLSRDAIFAWNSDRGITYWNQGAELLYGYPAEEAMGQDPRELLSTEYSESWEAVEEKLRSRGEWSGRLSQTGRSGLQTALLGRHQAVSGPDGEQLILEVNRDITAQLLSESNLAQARGELRVRERAVDVANDGILITDPRQDDNPIVYVNRGFERITGYSPDEVLGQNCRLLQGPGTDPETVRLIREAIADGAESRCVIYNYRKDGTPFWNELRIAPVHDESGELTHFIGIQSDVTKRVTAEQELRRAQQAADDANASKSLFLANMSHEIRTPLTSVIGLTDMLLAGGGDEETVSSLQMIRQSGQHLLGLINDILDLSKIEAGKLEIERRDCSPVEIIDEVLSVMRNRAEDKGLRLDLEYLDSIPKRIHTDPMRLRQILINLLSNAVKFTDQGRIRLAVRYFAEGDDSMIEFEVSDTGVGMSAAQVERLFEPFTQQDVSASRRFQGTGLGLCICRQLVEKLGGGIHVESTLGKGSTFRVVLSAGSPEGVELTWPDTSSQKAPRSKPAAAPICLDAHILVAEDTPGVQFLIRRFLEAAGAEVTMVETGKQVLELMDQEENRGRFDLILMDMHMPELSGYEATRRLRQSGFDRPVMALTASAMRGDREKCLEAGCDDYLAKPIDRQALLQSIAKLLSNSQLAPDD